MNEYNTNIVKLTCSCPDWQETREQYKLNDPRRLCKHIINKLDINNLPLEISKFKESVEFYQKKEWGFKRDFDKIIELGNFTLLGNVGWIDIFDEDGTRYGYLNDIYTGEHWWAKKKKPIGYGEVEEFFKKQFKPLPLSLQGKEKSDLIKYIKEVIPNKQNIQFSIEDDQYEPSPDGIYYCLNEYTNNYPLEEEVRHIIVRNNEIIIEMYYGEIFQYKRDYEYAKAFIDDIKQKEQERLDKEQKRLNNEKLIYEKELSEKKKKVKDKGYLWQIKGTIYIEIKKNRNCDEKLYYEDYIKATNKISFEYSDIKKLLENSELNITSLIFYKILNKLKMIKKVKTLNLYEWILIDNGLKYGINIEKDSKYFIKTVPDWYNITTIDPNTLKLVKQQDKQNVRMTKILWKNIKFKELLELVIKNMEKIENQSTKKKPVEKTGSKRVEREKWLINVSCHNCSSKNIHKKDKRQRKNFQVQRYQCIDCKSIFQEKIEEISIEAKI